jgi:ligand-binding sensor domain-containing protein
MRHSLYILLTVSAILISSIVAWSQNISLYSLTTNEGLSHIKVNDVYTDEHGMIWAGTDYGLNRYDGHSVEVFLNDKENPHSIPHNRITGITGDGNGHIWAVCPLGLVELDLKSCRFKNINKGNVNSVYYDKNNDRLYISKGRKVYKQTEDKKFTEIADVGIPSHISDLVTIGDDIYVGTSGYGIWKVNQTNKSIVCLVSSIKVTKMFLDSRSQIWAGSWQDGICRIDENDNVTTFRSEPASDKCLKSDFVRDCCEDKNGKIWIGTDVGLESYDPETNPFSHQYYSNYRHNNDPMSIWCLTRDGQGNIWFGT